MADIVRRNDVATMQRSPPPPFVPRMAAEILYLQQQKRLIVKIVAILAILLAGFALSSYQPVAVLYSGTVLVLGLLLLLRPGEPQVLAFLFVYQWLQASIKIFEAAITGLNWQALSDFGGDIRLASYLTLTGLLVLAIGIRLGAGRWRTGPLQDAVRLARRHSLSRWFKWYVVAFIVARIASIFADFVPALSQLFLALASLKWAFYFMLAYSTFLRLPGPIHYWLVAFVLELALGMFSFFSEFRIVMFFTLFAVMAAGIRLTVMRLLGIVVFAGITLFFALVWTAVKNDYRSFLNTGDDSQRIATSYSDSLQRLGELIAGLDGRDYAKAVNDLMGRMAYVDFFGRVLQFVPQRIAHAEGELWLDAISRPFMPRAFFPNKSIIDDSERTTKYSRVRIIGADAGTSVSIGYMGESYIDFGRYGMMLPIFAYGWLLGRVYRWLVINGSTRGLLGMGLATSVIVMATFLDSSITKIFGGLIATLLVVWALQRFVFPLLLPWCLAQGNARAHPPVARQVSP